jgi:hypothetical protein
MSNTDKASDDMKPEYDFDYSQGVRGKYFDRAMLNKHMVEVDADILAVFPSKEAVNAALRTLIHLSKYRDKQPV